MTKSLYDKQYRHTRDGTNLCEEIEKATRNIFKKYVDMGYSPREISHIAIWALLDHELDTALVPK